MASVESSRMFMAFSDRLKETANFIITSVKRPGDDQSRAPSKRRKIEVPLECQTAVRKVIKKLREDPSFSLSLTSYTDDEPLLQRIQVEVRRVFSDKNWSIGTVTEATKKVWKNMREDSNRRLRGKYEQHREAARANKMIRDKLSRRTKAIGLIYWPEQKKEEMRPLMTREFTSPEKQHDTEERTRYRIPFDWESNKLSKRKAELDECYKDSLGWAARRLLYTTISHPTDKTTVFPRATPDWAISRSYSGDDQ